MDNICFYCSHPAGPRGFCAAHWYSWQAFLARNTQPVGSSLSLMDAAFAEMSAIADGLVSLSIMPRAAA